MQRDEVVKAVLGVVAVVGILAMVAVVPNATRMLTLFDTKGKAKERYYVKTCIGKLVRGGHLALRRRDGRTFYEITAKGRKYLAALKLRSIESKTAKRWDKKWRLVVFDIRETRRSDRELLRRQLIRLGFFRLQHSVWVTPDDCDELITLIKTEFKLGSQVLYVIAEHVEMEETLLNYFGLEGK